MLTFARIETSACLVWYYLSRDGGDLHRPNPPLFNLTRQEKYQGRIHDAPFFLRAQDEVGLFKPKLRLWEQFIKFWG